VWVRKFAIMAVLAWPICGSSSARSQGGSPQPYSDETIEREVQRAGSLFGYMSGVSGGTAGALAAPLFERVMAAAAKDVQSVNRLGQCGNDAQCLSAEYQRREAAMMNQSREKSLRPLRDGSAEAIAAGLRRPWGSNVIDRLERWATDKAASVGDRFVDSVDMLTRLAEQHYSRSGQNSPSDCSVDYGRVGAVPPHCYDVPANQRAPGVQIVCLETYGQARQQARRNGTGMPLDNLGRRTPDSECYRPSYRFEDAACQSLLEQATIGQIGPNDQRLSPCMEILRQSGVQIR
jgi:hypothetical protein